MGNIDRARQFMPFDALKGLQEALREKEKEVEMRRELSEESLLLLDEQLQRIYPGDSIKVKFYKAQQYVEVKGEIENVDVIYRKIVMETGQKINFNDVVSIEIE